MSNFKERRKGADRRCAAPIQHFPILDDEGNFIEHDRRCVDDRRNDPDTSLHFIKASEFLARMNESDTMG